MLTISAKDFGPIAEGSVDLKPLTVFVGRSNTGKSYFATLVYAFMHAIAPAEEAQWSFRVSNEIYSNLEPSRRLHLFTDFIKAIGALDDANFTTTQLAFTELSEYCRESVIQIADVILEQIIARLDTELPRFNGSHLEMYRRFRSVDHFQTRLCRTKPFLEVSFNHGMSNAQRYFRSDFSEATTTIPEPIKALLDSPDAASSVAMVQLAFDMLFEGLPRNSYYLPAARSGIAQGHKAIASMLVRQSSLAGIRPMEIPTLPGIITDFMSHIVLMEQAAERETGGSLEGAIEFLEQKVVQGGIRVQNQTDVPYPDVTYTPFKDQPAMGSFPLQKTSSMVLAPVILFLKHLVQPGDLFILEEPESHLHPASQRQMARGIARLVNAGVKVIITTHSDYFVGQVNNLIKVSRASKAKRLKEGFDAEDCLKPEDVGAYHFKFDEELGGSVVKQIPIIPSYGIDDDEFGEVSLALYEETVSLQRIRAK